MSRLAPYAPMISVIIQTSSQLKNPTPRSVITRISKALLARTIERATSEIPPFVKAHLDDPNTESTLACRIKAALIAGEHTEIRSWNDAWRWLLFAHERITGSPRFDGGVDKVFADVFDHVTNERNDVDWSWLAIALGYWSIEEANNSARTPESSKETTARTGNIDGRETP
jgi:hypothetical protein